jgi:hypothetical protein
MSTDIQQQMQKTFWKRPEGTTGKILLGLAIAAGAVATYMYLPIILAWLVMVLENAVYAAVLGITLLVLTSPIWSSKVRALTGYMARSFLRMITAWFVEIDPIGILKNYVEDLRKNLSVMDKQIENLWGHITRLRNIIASNKAEAQHSLALAGAAQKTGKKAAFVLNARKQGRLEKSNMTLSALLTKMEALHKLLGKLRETSDVMVQDMESEVQVKEQERNALLAGYGAFTSAVKILRGDPDKRALFDQAMDYLAEDYAKKVGEIESFMTLSQGFIQSVDLDQMAYEQDALDKLNAQLDAKTDQLLLGSGDQHVRVVDTTAPDAELVPAGSDDVSDLFSTKK